MCTLFSKCDMKLHKSKLTFATTSINVNTLRGTTIECDVSRRLVYQASMIQSMLLRNNTRILEG